MLSRDQKIGDRYVILKSIGEGGMANVYLAHDTILDRDVAIKVLRGDLENNDKFIRRFQREAKSASDLSHPNIVEIFDVGEEDGQHYIVMEYIEGKTLKQLVQKRGGLTVAEVIDIMAQLTDGLAQAHDAYIIHRDIKPQNIMILDNGMVKITDFGIAMSMNATQLTQTNSVMGSVHYLPPEQASGKGATIKSDIYSSGILMYELLTGSVPFKGDNAVEIALKQMKERIPSIRKQNPLIPQSVENIILKATAKNLKNRYDSIKEMHDDIVHALDEDMIDVEKYNYPYPESDMDESKAIPIKDGDGTSKYKPVDMSGLKEDDFHNQTKQDDDKKPLSTKAKVLIIVSILVVLGMIGTLMFFNSRNKEKVIVVPDVSEMSVEEASELLEKKGFKYDIEFESSDEIDEGYVIKTKPGYGSSKKKGSIIIIVESTGTEDVVLQDYTNQNANTLKERLESSGLKVKIEKKELEDASDYVGKMDIVIEQSPKFNEEEEVTLKDGDEVILYVPDIIEDYPDMVEEEWILSQVEEFAAKYGLTLIVKDSKGNVITDYSNYLGTLVASQNRKGKIASGVAFTVTIAEDLSSYNLVVNFVATSGENLKNTEKTAYKNGYKGTYVCPGIKDYEQIAPTSHEFTINGKDVIIDCKYEKADAVSSDEDNETSE